MTTEAIAVSWIYGNKHLILKFMFDLSMIVWLVLIVCDELMVMPLLLMDVGLFRSTPSKPDEVTKSICNNILIIWFSQNRYKQILQWHQRNDWNWSSSLLESLLVCYCSFFPYGISHWCRVIDLSCNSFKTRYFTFLCVSVYHRMWFDWT